MSTTSTSTTIGRQLADLCREGRNLEAIETLYSDDIVSVEACPMPSFDQRMAGKAAVTGKNQWWVENHEVHDGDVAGPFPHGDDRFCLLFNYDVTNKPSGQRMQLTEVGLFTIVDGKITKEEFFYQMDGPAPA
ncbi:MAG: ketosteroid isomerase [Planctomycetaceae bacterium]|nr:ketosteroid isomerase [Planctomycetaceae bacterium]